MEKYPAIIVVEGISDKAFISSFLSADIITTNGSDVPRETIDYLKKVSASRDIVVLTDPDSPGKRIRDILDQHIDGLKHAYIRKEVSIKHHKVGVAESEKEEILNALANLVPSKKVIEGNLTTQDLYELGLIGGNDSSKKRKIVEEKLHLGHTNGKSLLQRINSLAISKDQLIEALK